MNYMLGKRGKVIAEFILNEFDFIKMPTNLPQEFLEKTCVNGSEIMKYLGGNFYKGFYAWHIDNLKIYNKLKELSEFYKHDNTYDNAFGWVFEDREKKVPLKRPPQSWFYVEKN